VSSLSQRNTPFRIYSVKVSTNFWSCILRKRRRGETVKVLRCRRVVRQGAALPQSGAAPPATPLHHDYERMGDCLRGAWRPLEVAVI